MNAGQLAAFHLVEKANGLPDVLEGVCVTGSWNPQTSTAQFTIGNTASDFADSGDQPIVIEAIVATHANGDQWGPVGGERATLRTSGGSEYVAHFEHADDDSPQTPAGEKWSLHKNPVTGQVDAYRKVKNDAVAQGDGLASIEDLAGAKYKLNTTQYWSISVDDATNMLVVKHISGLGITIDGNTGILTLGGGDGLGVEFAVIRKSDLDNALASCAQQFTSQLTTWAAAHVQPGSGATGPTLTAVPSTGSPIVQSA